MTEVNFYHLTQSSDAEALPLLLEKVIERKASAFIQVATKERALKLDAHLWVYDEASFLPHVIKEIGSKEDEAAKNSPIIISQEPPDNEQKDMLFLLEGSMLPENPDEFSRVFILFSGLNEDELDFARKQWKDVKTKNMTANYFQQTETGGWQKKA